MKKSLVIFLLLFHLPLSAQQLHVDWTRFVGGTGTCETLINNAIATKDKGVLFTGETSCSAAGDIPFSQVAAIGNAAMIGKMDSSGQLSWVKVYGGSQRDFGVSACETTDGGYAVLAYTQSADGDVTGFNGVTDLWLIKTDHSGNKQWARAYGSSLDDIAMSVAATPDNGFIMLGISIGKDKDVPFHYGTSQFNYDWIVIKTDSLGNKQWCKTIGGTGDEDVHGTILAANNGYYLVSSTNSTDYDCADTFWHRGQNTDFDIHLIRIDTSGKVLWDSSYGGPGGDVAENAIIDRRDSSIVMVGVTTDSGLMVKDYHSGSYDFLW